MSDHDQDGDGIPEFPSDQSFPGPVSRVRAIGNLGGDTVSGIDGVLVGNDFLGDYELVLAGLGPDSYLWLSGRLRVSLQDTDTPEDQLSYLNQSLDISNRAFGQNGAVLVTPDETVVNDHAYCFSEVRLGFRSTSGLIFSPSVGGPGGFQAGHFTGTDFQGDFADYGVGVSVQGTTPGGGFQETGLVVMCLPQGEYDQLFPRVRVQNPDGSSSQVRLPPVSISVGCRQVLDLLPELQIGLDSLPACSSQGTVGLSSSVNSSANINRIFATVNGGPQTTFCSDCEEDPDFDFTVNLGQCDNEIIVTAEDAALDVVSATVSTRFDVEHPMLSGCQDITVLESSPGSRSAIVNFDVSASDGCDGSLPIVCSEASGSSFPVGETAVTCTAVDAWETRGAVTSQWK